MAEELYAIREADENPDFLPPCQWLEQWYPGMMPENVFGQLVTKEGREAANQLRTAAAMKRIAEPSGGDSSRRRGHSRGETEPSHSPGSQSDQGFREGGSYSQGVGSCERSEWGHWKRSRNYGGYSTRKYPKISVI